MNEILRMRAPLALAALLALASACATTGGAASDYPHLDKSAKTRDERLEWWQDARFGMFIHWGLYAIPAGEWGGRQYRGYSEWLVQMVPVDQWEPLKDQFNPQKFDPEQWVLLAKQAGMKYIVITTKHHEGFSLFDSKVSDFDVMATPFRRDVMKELREACDKHDMRLGWYYSIMDWRHPDYIPRRQVDDRPVDDADYDRYVEFMKAQLTELLTNYGRIDVLWFDGGWEHSPQQHHTKGICDLAYRLQPDILINNRAELPMDFLTPEQKIPEEDLPSGAWETCMTITSSWGYNKGARNWKPSEMLTRNLIDIVSKGGNYLLNVGPTAEGVITPESQQRLLDMGAWLKVNGESIYGASRTPFRSTASTPWGRCTTRRLPNGALRLYLQVFEWPSDGRLVVPELATPPHRAYLLSNPLTTVKSMVDPGGDLPAVVLAVPSVAPDPVSTVIVLEYQEDPVTYHPVQILADSDVFMDDLEVRLETPSSTLPVRYTLDGSEPTADSPRYTGPIRLTDACLVRARCFYQGKPVFDPAERRIRKVQPLPAWQVEKPAKGLRYEYVEGVWDSVAGFADEPAIKTGIIDQISLGPQEKEEKFALRLRGFIRAPEDGVYVFRLTSDDGSVMRIQDEVVVDNDGNHSAKAVTGTVVLAKGLHPVEVDFFDSAGANMLEADWGLLGEPLERVPPSALFHAP